MGSESVEPSTKARPLQIGLYFDLRNPPAWAQSPTRLHGFTLEVCEEAERLGADSAWFTEHHLFDDGYLAQPLTFAAAVAARTKRIRLGTGIIIAPLHHPAELAEQAALVDIISGGRVDLGIGAGYRVPEFKLFGASMDRRYAQTDDMARALRRLWGPGGVTPPPSQDPLPIWMGYLGPQGARRAGLLGEHLLTTDARSWIPYRDGLIEAGHDPAKARMGGAIQAWVSDDPDKDWSTVSQYIGYQTDSYRRHMVMGTDRPTPRLVDTERLRHSESGVLQYFWCDTPEEIARRIRAQIAGAPVDTMYLWASIAGMPEDLVLRHVNTICTRLIPILRAAQPD